MGIDLPAWLLSMCAAKIGTMRASELVLSGQRITGEIAFNWGIVNVLGDGVEEVIGFAKKIARDVSKQHLHAKAKRVLFADLIEMKAKL